MTTIAPGNIQVMAYDQNDFFQGNVQFPHNIAQTNDLFPVFNFEPHLHICPQANVDVSGGNSNMTWELQWEPLS